MSSRRHLLSILVVGMLTSGFAAVACGTSSSSDSKSVPTAGPSPTPSLTGEPSPLGSVGGAGPHSPTAAPSTPATVASPSASVTADLVTQGLSIPAPYAATLYFGRLSAVVKAVGKVDMLATDSAFVAGHPNLCAGTVVVTNVAAATATVYAVDLGAGWGGAEGAPPSTVGVDGAVHHQLVTPPALATPGQLWTPSAEIVTPVDDRHSGSYRLQLQTGTPNSQTWTVNGSARVSCST